MTAIFKVVEPGPLTTVQDLGRYGFQQFGVPVSGALDEYSSRAANLLVGNAEDAALLEITFMGPKFEVLAAAAIAVTGAEIPILLNGRPQETWEAFSVRQGDTLVFKSARSGVRAYLAVSGGIDVPEVMGSRSTYLGAKLGGFQGRALARGDIVPRGDAGVHERTARLPEALRPEFRKEIVLRAVPGPQDDFFDRGSETFFGSEYKVSSKADRMGYRLEGPMVAIKEGMPKSIISEPSLAGAVQVPPDGQPIILLVEQTVGGYTKVATVISADIPAIAQTRPADLLRFSKVELQEARRIYHGYVRRLEEMREVLRR
jgi:antagonist of KipI